MQKLGLWWPYLSKYIDLGIKSMLQSAQFNCVLHHTQLTCSFSSQHHAGSVHFDYTPWVESINDSSVCKWDEFCCTLTGKILELRSHSGIRIAVLPRISTSITRYWTPVINSANSFLTIGILSEMSAKPATLSYKYHGWLKKTNFLVAKYCRLVSNDCYLIRLTHQAKPWLKASAKSSVNKSNWVEWNDKLTVSSFMVLLVLLKR